MIKGESCFPIDFPVGHTPKDYIDLRDAVNQLMNKSNNQLGYGYTVELEIRRTQKYGQQSLPKRIYIETEQDYLKLIKKEKEFLRFKTDLSFVLSEVPDL